MDKNKIQTRNKKTSRLNEGLKVKAEYDNGWGRGDWS